MSDRVVRPIYWLPMVFRTPFLEVRPARGRRVRPAILLLAGLAVAMGGCETRQEAAKKGTQQPDSLLTLISPPTPAEAAAWAIDPYEPDKRYRGLLLLVNAPFGGEPIYIEIYRRALTDSDSSVRGAAVRGLSMHGGPSDVVAIAPLLTDEDRLLRWEAARALQRLHNPAAVGPLLDRLFEAKEPEPEVRASVASALGQYAESRVLQALFASLSDRDLRVNRAALGALRTLTGQDFSLNMRAWVAWSKSVADPFAGRTAYVYPVFYRDKTWMETILPFWEPPNEIASTPVGFESPVSRTGAETSATTGNAADGSIRRN